MLGKRITRSAKWNIKMGRSKRTKIFEQEEDFFVYFANEPSLQWLNEM